MPNFDSITTQFLQTPSGQMASVLLSRQGLALDDVMHQIHAQVIYVLPGMEVNVRYTTRNLCDDKFWKRHSYGTRRAAGMCLRHLVETGELPLQRATKDGAYPLKYVIQPPAALGGEGR